MCRDEGTRLGSVWTTRSAARRLNSRSGNWIGRDQQRYRDSGQQQRRHRDRESSRVGRSSLAAQGVERRLYGAATSERRRCDGRVGDVGCCRRTSSRSNGGATRRGPGWGGRSSASGGDAGCCDGRCRLLASTGGKRRGSGRPEARASGAAGRGGARGRSELRWQRAAAEVELQVAGRRESAAAGVGDGQGAATEARSSGDGWSAAMVVGEVSKEDDLL